MGYVLGGCIPKEEERVKEANDIRLGAHYGEEVQRIFGKVEFGSEKHFKNSSAFVSTEGEGVERL